MLSVIRRLVIFKMCLGHPTKYLVGHLKVGHDKTPLHAISMLKYDLYEVDSRNDVGKSR